MKVAIMQPYFFPYLGYLSLINSVDKFIVFDTPQYMRKGWIERNRILKLTGGSVYIKVPLLKAPLGTPINQVFINQNIDWVSKITAQLQIYKKAPYFDEIFNLVEDLCSQKYETVSELNTNILIGLCKYCSISTAFEVYSKLDLEVSTPSAPDEWALNICKALGVTEYINAAGGRDFFNVEKYQEQNINISFLEQTLFEYKQLGKNFEPGLSIIDVMMFNSPERIREYISNPLLNS